MYLDKYKRSRHFFGDGFWPLTKKEKKKKLFQREGNIQITKIKKVIKQKKKKKTRVVTELLQFHNNKRKHYARRLQLSFKNNSDFLCQGIQS